MFTKDLNAKAKLMLIELIKLENPKVCVVKWKFTLSKKYHIQFIDLSECSLPDVTGLCYLTLRFGIVFVWVFSPTREFFTHVDASPSPVKGCKFWRMLGTHAHWAVRFFGLSHTLLHGHPFIMVISKDPWHPHLLPGV